MSAVTAWSMPAPSRRQYPTGVAGYQAEHPHGAQVARRAYRAMRKAGIEIGEARGYVLLLLGVKVTFLVQGRTS